MSGKKLVKRKKQTVKERLSKKLVEKGLTPISKVPVEPKKAPIECPICMDVIFKKHQIKLVCSHTFHRNCINKWRAEKINALCPLCRGELKEELDFKYPIEDMWIAPRSKHKFDWIDIPATRFVRSVSINGIPLF
jgi:hypothetical protein